MFVINMFGGPGSGKTSLAHGLMAYFKTKTSYKVEMVTEYVKGAVYGKNYAALGDQHYLTAKHLHNLNKLRSNVDLVITDCSLLNAIAYTDSYTGWQLDQARITANSCKELYATFDNINLFVPRYKQYQQYGRSQTLEEAIDLDAVLRSIFDMAIGPKHEVQELETTIKFIEGVICQQDS